MVPCPFNVTAAARHFGFCLAADSYQGQVNKVGKMQNLGTRPQVGCVKSWLKWNMRRDFKRTLRGHPQRCGNFRQNLTWLDKESV
jgi:hypothetical protein